MPKKSKCQIAEVLRKIIEDESDEDVDLTPAKHAIVNMLQKNKMGKKPRVVGMKLFIGNKLPKGFVKVTKVKKIN